MPYDQPVAEISLCHSVIALADQSVHEISNSADAAQYDVLSGRLDELHKSDPLRYEAVVRLSEMEEALEDVRPDIRLAFGRVLELVGEVGWREALSRTDEIRLYINEQGQLGQDRNTARGEKINEVVEECLRKQLKQGEERLAADPSLKTATVDELDKLRRYHLGPERLNLWRSKVTEMQGKRLGFCFWDGDAGEGAPSPAHRCRNRVS